MKENNVAPFEHTDCQLTLIGYLKAIPNINNCKCILLERQHLSSSNHAKDKKSELYFVHLNEHDFSRIHNFGFVGMLIFVCGELEEADQKIKIIAKKIDFLHLPASGKLDRVISLSDEMLFSTENIEKLKNSIGYQSNLYYEALKNIH